jgi:hypothetical protein
VEGVETDFFPQVDSFPAGWSPQKCTLNPLDQGSGTIAIAYRIFLEFEGEISNSQNKSRGCWETAWETKEILIWEKAVDGYIRWYFYDLVHTMRLRVNCCPSDVDEEVESLTEY